MRPSFQVGQAEFYLTIEAAGTEKGGIEGVGPVGGHQHLRREGGRGGVSGRTSIKTLRIR